MIDPSPLGLSASLPEIELEPIAAPRRYLLDFDPIDLPHHFTDVLVIGGGIAGLRAALEIPERYRVLVVTKDAIRESNSAYAQGGIAGVLDPEDHFEDHIADTLAAGKGLCDPQVVSDVVREAPERIAELIAWGVHFDEAGGVVSLGLEGGHSKPRIVHALGDATGREVMRAIVARSQTRENIRIWQNSFTIDILTSQGECRGALVWDKRRGASLIWSRATILATGGAGQLYRESTNPPIATADGHALAYRAGAVVRDMEFMQFHPTVLYVAGSARHLLTEAIRGEGARLIDCRGHRFMPDAHRLAELAPRDDVSRAIVERMEATRHPCVYLDLTQLDPDRVRARFPGINRLLSSFDLDLTRDRIPVRPGAHYMIGGVAIDRGSATSLRGLWAAGEATSSGLHGANRLASNSLLEGLVFGCRAARSVASHLDACSRTALEVPRLEFDKTRKAKSHLDLGDIREALRSLMWRLVGISRDRAGLDQAAERVDYWSGYVLPASFSDPAGWELQNMLLVARLMIASARIREESRGVHFRSDFPEARGGFAARILVRNPLGVSTGSA